MQAQQDGIFLKFVTDYGNGENTYQEYGVSALHHVCQGNFQEKRHRTGRGGSRHRDS